MNCTQVKDLLPLYAGRDLNDGREQSITAHLLTCARCGAAAKEYGETRQLLQEFAPPAFANDVYAEVRQRVWRQIETESESQRLPEFFAGWFRPRMVWAVASVLLIMVSVVGVYFIGKRMTVSPPVAVRAPKTNSEQRQRDARSNNHKLAAAPSSPARVGNKKPQSGPQPYKKKLNRTAAPDSANSLARHSPDAEPSKIERPLQVDVTADADITARSAGRTLRMEIQTKNPNIRIIWFAPRDTKQPSSNSKGT